MGKHKDIYNSTRWRKRVRPAVVARDNGLCQMCLRHGILRPGTEVHHKIELTDSNKRDDTIAFGMDNLELLCWECHELTKTRSSLIGFVDPIPPGAGKKDC